MPAISLLPAAIDTARLVVALAGSEWLEFDAVLAPATRLRLEPGDRPFPARGTVSIRRGLDRAASGERIPAALRYIASCTDDVAGESADERFGVSLFMEEGAFDRLTARVHWGLPAVDLLFDAYSAAIAPDPKRGEGHWCFRMRPRPWEAIASATLTQRSGLQAGTGEA